MRVTGEGKNYDNVKVHIKILPVGQLLKSLIKLAYQAALNDKSFVRMHEGFVIDRSSQRYSIFLFLCLRKKSKKFEKIFQLNFSTKIKNFAELLFGSFTLAECKTTGWT